MCTHFMHVGGGEHNFSMETPCIDINLEGSVVNEKIEYFTWITTHEIWDNAYKRVLASKGEH